MALDAAPNKYGLAIGEDKKPVAGGPAMPSPQPFVRGEKQWMDNGQNINDWQDQQMTKANTRLPYFSTVQMSDDEFDREYEAGVNMNILYEDDNKLNQGELEKVVNVGEEVPVALRFVQLEQDDDPSKIEGMMMEDPNIPLDLRFAHLETEEGDELIRIV